MMLFGQWTALAAALLLDAAFGDPDWLWRRVRHPVVWIGRLIAALDRHFNREDDTAAARRAAGIATTLLLVLLAVVIGVLLERLFQAFAWGWIGTAIVAAVLLAGRSLYDHVSAVARALEEGGLTAGRKAVARIVGRDPDSLDASGVARATVESAAENFSDGLVAPALWFALAGLPGIIAYKAVNTADSMIGHLSDRHRDFGWAAARLDDVMNWPAARLSALLIAVAAPAVGGSPAASLRLAIADSGHHRSPNAGWPEAAMAGALDLRLGGPRIYDGEVVDDPPLNADGRPEATADDIRHALRVIALADALLFFIVVGLATALPA